MRLSESEKANPQDYFLPRDTGQLDDQGQPIIAYDLKNEEVADYSPAKAFRKKVFDGNADIVVSADTVHIYWKGELIAQAQLEGQVETSPGVWQGQLFSFADANVQKITEVEGEDIDGNPIMVPVTPFFRAYEVKDILALGITDAVFGLDVHWAFKDTKLSFYLDAPGYNARIRWQCRVKDSAVAWTDDSDPKNPVYHKGLSFNVSDYEGEVNHGSQADPEPGWTQHWWTFEPSGKQIDAADARTPLERYEQGVGLVVDPYLYVDDVSSYAQVYSDGYWCRISKVGAGGGDFGVTWTFPSLNLVGPFYSDIGAYRFGLDNTPGVSIFQNTATCARLVRTGVHRNASAEPIPNEDWCKVFFTFYPDKVIIEFILSMNGSHTWDAADDTSTDGFLRFLLQNLDNESYYYENSGSETQETGVNFRNSAKYIYVTGDEADLTFIVYDSSFQEGSIAQLIDATTNFSIVFKKTTNDLSSGIYSFKLAVIVDSAQRAGSAKIYNAADRLAIANQFLDLEIDLTEGGSRVFDDGSSQYLQISGTPPVVVAPMTLVGWAKSDAANTGTIISLADSGQPDDNIRLFINSDYSARLIVQESTAADFTSSNTGNINTWHHFAGILVSSTERYVYLDGDYSNRGSNTENKTPVGLNSMAIGRSNDSTPSAYMSGKIAHAAIWNVALTDAEVARLAAGALPTEIRPESLVAYWPLVDDDNDPIGGYNMTAYNSPTWSTTDYPNVFKPDKGKWEIQDILPAVIEESGFQSDGAWHIVPIYKLDEENFTNSNGIHLENHESNWNPNVGRMTIASNKIYNNPSSGNYSLYSWQGQEFDPSQYAQIQISIGVGSGSMFMGVGTRINPSSANGYYFFACLVGGGYQSYFGKIVDGSWSDIGGDRGAYANNDILGMRWDNSNGWELLKNGIVIDSGTDDSFSSGYAGIAAYGIGYSSYIAGDNWKAGNLNPKTKYTIDRTRIRPATVIHEWPFQYGTVASPTSILLNHLKMDDNAANNTLLATVGPNGSWHAVSDGSARNTSNDSVATGNFRGRALDTQDGTGYGQLAVGSGTVHNNAYLTKGSALIKVTPQFVYNTGDDQVFLKLRYDSNNHITIYYQASDDKIYFNLHWNGSTQQITSGAFTENYSLQKQTVILVAWASDRDFLLLAIDSGVIGTGIHTSTPTTSDPTTFTVGCQHDRSTPGDIIIDEIKTFSEAVLPYGAYFIGNGSGLLADIDNPHADLTWFFDGQAAAAKGGSNLASDKNPTNSGGSFVTTDPILGTYHWDSSGEPGYLYVAESSNDIIDYDEGTIGMWIKLQTSPSFYSAIVWSVYGDANNFITLEIVSGGNALRAWYNSQGTMEVATASNIFVPLNVWTFVGMHWNGNGGQVNCFMNGIEGNSPQDIANTWNGGNSLTNYFGTRWDQDTDYDCDLFIQNVYISKKANTPQIWTAFGKPLHVPLTNLG